MHSPYQANLFEDTIENHRVQRLLFADLRDGVHLQDRQVLAAVFEGKPLSQQLRDLGARGCRLPHPSFLSLYEAVGSDT